MKRRKQLVALCLAPLAVGISFPVVAQESLPLAFMRTSDYRALSLEEKVRLAQDFMRSFCGSLTMPIVPFVHCIDDGVDDHPAGEPIFDDLKACVRALS